jgi:hypothetical protein
MRTLLLWGAVALAVWAGAAVIGLVVQWDDRLTPALAGAWAAAAIGATLAERRRARRR